MPAAGDVKTAGAWAPAHVTAFFKIYPNGSTGAGLNIEEGVTTEVHVGAAKGRGKAEVRINGKKSAAETSRAVIREFLKHTNGNYNITIRHKTKLPIGYGMGASGAGALSLALALNSALGTKLSRKLCEKTARRAEIECGTGLGDTTAQMNAGVFYGKKPYPSKTAVRIKTKKRHVALGFFAPIKTKNIIRSAEWKGKINRSGTWCMGHIEKNRNVDALMHCARVFAVETGLATRRVRAVMNEIPEAGQAMLGETVFMLTNSPASARAALKKHTHRVIVSRIAKKGAHVL